MANQLTYISLFSGAGIGCYGFKLEGFKCIATIELIERRLNVQKYNNKCKYDSGYILGDITQPNIKNRLLDEIELWKREDQLSKVDVIIATPPCQGMSVANHKKNSQEIIRNSLIIESIEIIIQTQPRIFIFENVPLFLRTLCTDIDGTECTIGEAIDRNLGRKYSIYSKVINFKDYGACSSRTRTLVIGVHRDFADHFSPIELFPTYKPEITLRQCIGKLKSLKQFGEIDENDIYHSFRVYPHHMRAWISELAEGQSAFDNEDVNRIPHRIINGKIVFNKNKNGDKYRRQIWDKVGPCVHTRNDQLASQNTIHPSDDRVFSIRELMMMLTVPKSFRWADIDLERLNAMCDSSKRAFLRKHEINIRQSLGEAVPTSIFRSIAANIKSKFEKRYFNDMEIRTEISAEQLADVDKMINYINTNPRNLGLSSLCRVVELANSQRNVQKAYFTNKTLINEIIKELPDISKDSVHILEPSVGAGSFIPFIVKSFEHMRKIFLTVVDIDENALKILRELLKQMKLPRNIHINFICADFLTLNITKKYDIVIGNPPFSKSTRGKLLDYYRSNSVNEQTTNTSAFFIEKALKIGNYVTMIMPKFLLNTPEYKKTRDLLSSKRINAIIDFGEKGFNGVLIETIAVCVNPNARPTNTKVISVTDNEKSTVPQKYICDKRFPYWIIYRNKFFDEICNNLEFNIFEVFRDRQLTNSMMTTVPSGIRVLKSRNISDDGLKIINIEGYDAYVSQETAKDLSVYRFIDNNNVYLTPNMTYNPRVIRKPKGVLVNGSVAILILKDGQPPLTEEEIRYFSSDEFRKFYRIARNKQTRSLNVDTNSVFFYGRNLQRGHRHNEMA
ncbi:MAG: DNA cytosine methyltransferase [Bacilli bacterium]